jgi:hypothetical protein
MFSQLHYSQVVGGTLYRGEYSLGDTKLEIPYGANDIEYGAFQSSERIEEIIFPKTLRIISSHCFQSCKKLKRLIIPGNVKEIGGSSFARCSSLETVLIEEGTIEIDHFAFSECTNLKDVTLPSTLKKIGIYAFSDCSSLECIIIPEGIEEIEEESFRRCCNLKYVSLPKTLKKIEENAFDTQCYNRSTSDMRDRESEHIRIMLPAAIEEIGENAFGEDAKHICFFVPKGSAAEKYAKDCGASIVHAEITQGALIGMPVRENTLCYVRKNNKKYVVPNGIERIAEYAFYGCDEIEELVIPASVKEICAHATSGVGKLSTLTFEIDSSVKYIGSKAFEGFRGGGVDLPPSVEYVAPDAFPETCILSIGGEMPLYSAALTAIAEQEAAVEKKKEELADLDFQVKEANQQLQRHIDDYPSQVKDIPKLNRELSTIAKEWVEETDALRKKRDAVAAYVAEIETEIHSLIAERKNCFPLAFSRKRELDEKIARKQEEVQGQKNHLADLTSQAEKTKKDFSAKTRKIKEEIDYLTEMQSAWNIQKLRLTEKKDKVKKERLSVSTGIAESEDKLNKERTELEEKHTKWVNDKNAAIQKQEEQKRKAEALLEKQRLGREERRRIADLEKEKKNILSTLVVPKIPQIPTFVYRNRSAVVEESLLNKAFLKLVCDLNDENNACNHNDFMEEHAVQIQRVKEINLVLGHKEGDGIEHVRQREHPVTSDSYIPERFMKLAKRFAALDAWGSFKCLIFGTILTKKKNKKQDIQDKFFLGTEYFTLSSEGVELLVFPYCMVLYRSGTPLGVLAYNEVKIQVDHTDKEEITETVSPFGELVGERYTHANKDGSANRRYSNNPIIKTIRYTTLTIATSKDSFTFPVKAYQEALHVKDLFEAYCRDVTTDLMEGVYGLIARSESLADIEEAMDNLAREEALRLERQAQKEAEEKQRIEEERQTAIREAEERRRVLIQRQRELNEERRRQAEEKNKALQLFEDDFSTRKQEDYSAQSEKSDVRFSVVGSMMISNNVFKVVVKQEAMQDKKECVALFVSGAGVVISNKKKIVMGEGGIETTLGFVLVSGIDYTQMKKCYMKITTEDEDLQSIEFKMNISFYSDF